MGYRIARHCCAALLILASLFFLVLETVAQQDSTSPANSKVPKAAPAKAEASTTTVPQKGEGSLIQKSSSPRDDSDLLRRRAEWFYRQRASVNGRIPRGAYQRAVQHLEKMLAAEGKLRPASNSNDASAASALVSASTFPAWTPIGPTPTTGGEFSPVTGRVMTIAVDPSDSSGNTVLLGGAMGGIWRSTDAGATWTAVGDQNASLAMGSIAFAPSNPSIVYAGTGEGDNIGFDVYYGAGVLKSIDHGQTWVQTCTTPSTTCPFIGPYSDVTPFGFFTLGGTRISYVAVNPANSQMVLVGAQTQFAEGTTEGVYCSDNGGTTWSDILPDELSSFVGFASSTVAYAALGNPFGSSTGAPNGNGIYKATSIGSTCATVHFLRLTSGTLPPQSSMGRIDIGIAPSDSTGKTLYASIADASTFSSTNLGVYLSTDGGSTWTRTSAPDVCRQQCWYDNVVKVDPLHAGTAFLAGGAASDGSGNPSWVVRTINNGATWSSVIPNLPLGSSGLPHVDNHALAFFKLPNGKVRLYLGNDGGVWRTDDAEVASVQWTNLNNLSLTLTQFYPSISMPASNPAIAFGGTQDNGSQNYSGSLNWVDNALCGDGASTAVDALVPSTVYIGCATGFPVNVSYQDGAIGTFSPAVDGINPNDTSGFIPPIVVDPSTPNVLYFGTTKVYQSVDAGNTWTALSPDLVDPSQFYLNALAVAPRNPSLVYAGASYGPVFVSRNVSAGTGTFSGVPNQAGGGFLPIRTVTAIAVDPSDATGMTAYVAYSGFSDIDFSVTPHIYDPNGHIFKTTDAGTTWVDVSCSVQSSTTWCATPAATDLPNIPVNDIVLDPDVPGTIYAATDVGVFIGNCSVSPCTWSTLGTGLPRAAVLSLRLHEASRTLRAATHGRGAWDIALNNFSFNGPHISSIIPISANSGGGSFTLTVNGSGLTGGAVQWNGSATGVTMTQVTDTELTASIAASLLTIGGTPPITVKVGTQTSNALPFSVLGSTPKITGITPASTPVQTPAPTTNVTIQINGTGFSSTAKILWNGAQNGITVAAPTASCPLPTCLSVTLPANLLGPFGSTNDIQVSNLPPGGGKSNVQAFRVAAPPPPNDNFANAINITTLSFNDMEDSSGATTETTDPIPPCVTQFTSTQGNTGGQQNGRYNTIWYKFTPPFSANLSFVYTADTRNLGGGVSNYDTVLSIWTGGAGSLTSIGCNDDINPGIILQSEIDNVPLTAGTTYYIMVSSFGPPDPNPIALGGKSTFAFSYNNGFYPAPTLSSLSPASANSGDPDLTLTINGSNFFAGDIVNIDNNATFFGSALTPTSITTTKLTVIIPASTMALPGQFTVLVLSPPPNFTPSNSLPFTVNLGTYPVPVITPINPTSVIAGSLPFNINALCANCTSTAVLFFNGVAKPTTVSNSFIGSFPQAISATISTADISTPGTVQVTVNNPTPGGGPSAPQSFTITQPTVVPTISSVSPSSGPSSSPVNITITGTNFVSGAALFFNGTYWATNFVSSTQLTALLNTPTAAGIYPINVVDPAPAGTSSAVNFTVVGPPDFTLMASGTATQTVNAGTTATYTNVLTVSPQNGFTGAVNLSCSLVATATHCSVNPPTLTSGSATVTVTTTARGLMPPTFRPPLFYWPFPIYVLSLAALVAAIFFAIRSRRFRLAFAIPVAAIVLILLLQAAGCGGGSSGPPPPPPPVGTQAGTYTINVTATSGSLTHTTTLTLIVN